MTNGWIDIKNTDMMLIMGGNPAENHPCGFKWAMEAKRQRNAKMIVVDPRFTRTAAVADLFLQIRAGSDIAFLGGFITTPLQNNRDRPRLSGQLHECGLHREGRLQAARGRPVLRASTPASQSYDKSTWNYEECGTAADYPPQTPGSECPRTPAARRLPIADTSEHPRCVFQLLKKQYSRYTPEMVERITGIPKDQFLKAAELFTSVRKDGDMKKVATIIYAVGWTQHSFGNADHPHRRHAAIAAGQCRAGGRRRERAARALEHSGRYRYGRYFRYPARLSEGADTGR